MTDPLFRVAIVGCGAVTRASLLPVLAGHDKIRVAALVDRDVARARQLAGSYGIDTVYDDLASLTREQVDGVVLATPPSHHAPATLALMERGFHVFVEKPMAIGPVDARAMVAAADTAGVALTVGLYRRLLPVARLMRALIEDEFLGRPLSVDVEEGGEYSWELATLSVLTRAGGGGGVLIDIGSHLLDQLFFILPSQPRLVSYADNARGGIETDCEVRLELTARWGPIPVRMELSRTRQLRGSIRVECEQGTLELLRQDFCRVHVHRRNRELVDVLTGHSREVSLGAEWAGAGDLVGYKAFREEFDDWLAAVRRGVPAQLSGRSVVPVVEIIDDCYRSPTPLAEPWTDDGLDVATSVRAPAVVHGRKPRVLVTGAGGFLGCRTVELLHASGVWDVRPLVRRPGSAARLARLGLDVVLADVMDRADVGRALDGCDAVVHCAVGTGWPPETAFKTTVEGTQVVADLARAAGVQRFVHVSSMAVHGERVPARLDETVPLYPGRGVDYGRAKFLAEQAVMAAHARGLPAIALRPARIYGPFSRTFTLRPLSALGRNALLLSGDADSPSNMVYVDNVVDAIIKALGASEAAVGHAFLISEPHQRSWCEFYEYFAPAGAQVRVGPARADGADDEVGWTGRLAAGGKDILLSPELRAIAKKVMWTDPFGTIPRRVWERSPGLQRRVLGLLGVDEAVVYREPLPDPPEVVEFTIVPTLVAFDKARDHLGYRGGVATDHAMALTRQWAQYARLI